MAGADVRHLLERVREQEGVIRRLWDRYTQDVGAEPDVGEIASLGGKRHVPARREILRQCLAKEKSFEDAVEELDFECVYAHAEVTTQRLASQLMHDRRPAIVARKTGDIILRGFWGRGVSMPAFERLLLKVKNLQHGALRRTDFSDNGLNGNFVPGLIELLRRGARQLDVSRNLLEAAAAQQLCGSLPHICQYLEVLDLRGNPCSSDRSFILGVSKIVPQLSFLLRLGVTVREGDGPQKQQQQQARQHSRQGHRGGRAASSSATAAPRRGAASRSSSVGHSRVSAAGGADRLRQPSPPRTDVSSWRIRSSMSGQNSVSAADGPVSTTRIRPERPAVIDLCGALAHCQRLQTLDLRGSLLGHVGTKHLAQLLRHDRLVGLGLAECFMGERAEPVLDVVKACRSLTWLNLRLNAIGGHTGTTLALLLAESVSLTDVDMASNGLDDDFFGEAFGRALALNQVLWKVDLVRNPLGLRSGRAILEALRRRNSTLTSIGDTIDGFFSFGLETRHLIQSHLDRNRAALCEEPTAVDGLGMAAMEPGLAGFDWKILSDEPACFEPLAVRG